MIICGNAKDGGSNYRGPRRQGSRCGAAQANKELGRKIRSKSAARQQSLREGIDMTSLNSKPGCQCTIEVQPGGNSVLVKCKGRLVFGFTDVLNECVKDLLPKSKRIVVDLAEVTYMDSSGLGTIVRIYVSAKASRCELQLLNLAPQVRQMFGVTRIISLFEPLADHNIRFP
jgi:anti-sigma B factor antagonist